MEIIQMSALFINDNKFIVNSDMEKKQILIVFINKVLKI